MEQFKVPRRSRRGVYEFPSSDEEPDPATANGAGGHVNTPVTEQIDDSDEWHPPSDEDMQSPASEYSAAAGGGADASASEQDEQRDPEERSLSDEEMLLPAGEHSAAAGGAAGVNASATDQTEHREASAEREPAPRTRKRRRLVRSRSPSPEPDALVVRDGSLRVTGAPGELSASLDSLLKETPELVKQTQRWLTQNRPRITRGLAEVREILPRLPVGPNWTAEQGAAVYRDWLAAPSRPRLLDVNGKKELLTLYKACLRLMRCLPEDIISCRFNLEYDLSQNRNLARGPQSLLWSSSFCTSLVALLVHPMWNCSVAALAVAIQYAVIVDTGDLRDLDAEVPGTDMFLRRLLDPGHQASTNGAVDARRELHRRMSGPLRDVYGRETGPRTSPWDVLFEAIENTVDPRQPEDLRLRSGPFQVHSRHLEMVGKALDSVSHMGFPRQMPVNLYNRAIGGRRSTKDYPQQRDLRELRSYSILCERERLALKMVLDRKKRLATGDTDDSDSGADADIDSDGDLYAESDYDSDVDSRGSSVDSGVGANVESNVDSHSGSSVGSSLDPHSGSDVDPDANVDTSVDSDAGPAVESNVDSDMGSDRSSNGSNVDPSIGSGVGSNEDSNVDSKANSHRSSDVGSSVGSDSDSNIGGTADVPEDKPRGADNALRGPVAPTPSGSAQDGVNQDKASETRAPAVVPSTHPEPHEPVLPTPGLSSSAQDGVNENRASNTQVSAAPLSTHHAEPTQVTSPEPPRKRARLAMGEADRRQAGVETRGRSAAVPEPVHRSRGSSRSSDFGSESEDSPGFENRTVVQPRPTVNPYGIPRAQRSPQAAAQASGVVQRNPILNRGSQHQQRAQLWPEVAAQASGVGSSSGPFGFRRAQLPPRVGVGNPFSFQTARLPPQAATGDAQALGADQRSMSRDQRVRDSSRDGEQSLPRSALSGRARLDDNQRRGPDRDRQSHRNRPSNFRRGSNPSNTRGGPDPNVVPIASREGRPQATSGLLYRPDNAPVAAPVPPPEGSAPPRPRSPNTQEGRPAQ